MKNLINYIYQIDILNIKNINNDYLIKTKQTNYILKNINDVNNIDFIINISNNINSYKIKKNIFYNYISNIKGNNYILINMLNDYEKEVDFNEMIEFYNKSSLFLHNLNYTNIWDKLWVSKVDYLTIYAKNNLVDNKNIMPLFYYYIGIAETAILYIKDINKKYVYDSSIDKISFCHRRIFYPNIKLNFYNPFNYNVDLEVRDIAEYIKICFYNNEDYLNELEYYLKVNKLSKYSASMLFGRIIYPSYFFDYFESKDSKISKERFLDTLSYESFIKKTYELINSYVHIDKIDYLIDQH